MNKGSNNRIQYAGDRQYNGYKIERHGEGQIHPDCVHHLFGEQKKVGQFLYFIIDKSNTAASTAISLPTFPMAIPT